MKILVAFLLCVGLVATEPIPHIYPIIEVVKIHDGDTVKIKLDVGFNMTAEYSVRINGVDTPEVTGFEKEAGKVVREVVVKWIDEAQTKGPLYVKYDEFGKYAGRFVGDILDVNGHSLSAYLIHYKWSKPWDGKGASPTYSTAELQFIIER
jgi:micrococcal nuclease